MAIRRLKKSRIIGDKAGRYRNVFALDSESDISGLPTNTEGRGEFGPVACDSMAVIIGDGGGAIVLMLNGDGRWVEV